ncbi:MAG: tRNA (adenosine(37)-N6)-threonylcarbamoyltransferase complex transferase subunit TsaD [bacterium]|nr:tRNA (adenosine(37)-N6)-threonylcarbamoyltransferase complex transferase subunit TsaD [bacterium]
MSRLMKLLGIETSCDETAAGVVEDGRRVLSNVIHSQLSTHAPYGGVVPELAGREHIEKIYPVVERTLNAVGGLSGVNGVAVTYGPGLNGSLLVGLSFARALCLSAGLPLYAVNHLEGHLAALRLLDDEPEPPLLVLLATGGHTALYLVTDWGRYEIIGTTLDDAVGEAFDKVARLLGLGYPGGPAIEKAAVNGSADAFDFPIPMRGRGFDYSFSGLKTAVAVKVKEIGEAETAKNHTDIAASFQRSAIRSLVEKLGAAMSARGIGRCAVVGGVAANEELRKAVSDFGEVYVPPPELCGDNGAMIAAAGFIVAERDGPAGLSIDAVPSLKL